MSNFDWSAFLSEWNAECKKIDDIFNYIYGPLKLETALSFENTKMLVNKLESRLAKPLPASFRNFLEASVPHFTTVTYEFSFLKLENIDWLGNSNPRLFNNWNSDISDQEWITLVPADSNLTSYGQLVRLTLDQKEILQNTLMITDRVVLNPAVSTAEGEWETWYLDAANLFVIKYPTFLDLIQKLRNDFFKNSQVLKLEPTYLIDPTNNEKKVVYPWREFLQSWCEVLLSPGTREEVFLSEENLEQFDLKRGWLGFPEATEMMLEEAEKRLGTRFPVAYRQFLQVTNGFPFHQRSILLELLPISQVRWWADMGYDLKFWQTYGVEEATQADEDYYDYSKQDGYTIRTKHAAGALVVGDFDGNDYYVLNPLALSENGEWEAWIWYHEGGAERYPSFWHMLQSVYYGILHIP